MSHKRVTIKEVAAAASVSTQTVSRVVNGRPDVAPDTREHVQMVIGKLGYKPSKIARSLSRGQSYSLGVASFGIGLYGPSFQTVAQTHCATKLVEYELKIIPRSIRSGGAGDGCERIGQLEYNL
jgi:DNA-binding LacI/PurR family transcriptional regulator